MKSIFAIIGKSGQKVYGVGRNIKAYSSFARAESIRKQKYRSELLEVKEYILKEEVL